MADTDALGDSLNGAAGGQMRSEVAGIHVGGHCPQRQDAVRSFDKFDHFLSAEGTHIGTRIQAMFLRNDRFAEQGRANRNIEFLRKSEERGHQAHALDLDTRQNHRLLSGDQHGEGFPRCLAKLVDITGGGIFRGFG